MASMEMFEYNITQFIYSTRVGKNNYAIKEVLRNEDDKLVSEEEYIAEGIGYEHNGLVNSRKRTDYELYKADFVEHLRTHPFYECQNMNIKKPFTYVAENSTRDVILIRRLNEDVFVDTSNKRLAIAIKFSFSLTEPYIDVEKTMEYLSSRNDISFLDEEAPARAKVINHIFQNRDGEKEIVPILWAPTQESFDSMMEYFNASPTTYISSFDIFCDFIGIGKFFRELPEDA